MGFYDDIAVKDVAPLIAEYGADVTLRQVTEGAYDPTTGQQAADTVTDYPVKGILKEYADGAIDGTIVKQGDQKILFPGTIAVAPEPGFKVVLNGEVWGIPVDSPGAVKKVAPGGVAVVYEVRVRK